MRLIPSDPGETDLSFTKGMRIKALKDLLDLPDLFVVTVNQKSNLAIMREDGTTLFGFIDLLDETRILFEDIPRSGPDDALTYDAGDL